MSKSRDLGEFPAAALDIDASGAITTTGPINGRDVATDGAKLDTIETSADVTDTANVTSSGALMDSELASIASVKALNQGVATTDDPTFTNTHLAAIDATIAATAVDTFVYDTRKDSDGGAWRKRTQGTSWYNEALNTATRGSTKEFPAVAVIVAEAAKVTIYDGDDPSMPMWMVFAPNGIIDWPTSTQTRINVSALNGILVTACGDGGHLFKFVKDYVDVLYNGNYNITSGRTILDRNNTTTYTAGGGNNIIVVHYAMNDVAMTVLPNAPIDPATGLPVPTIAVATDGGVSVIKDDGTVVNIVNENSSYRITPTVNFDSYNAISFTNTHANGVEEWLFKIHNLPSNDTTVGYKSRLASTDFYLQPSIHVSTDAVAAGLLDGYYLGSTSYNANNNKSTTGAYSTALGLTVIDENRSSAVMKSGIAYITSDYNTGYMVGDIKLAALSDTDDTDVTDANLASLTSLEVKRGGSISVSGSVATVTASGVTSWSGALDRTDTVVGKSYAVSITCGTETGSWHIMKTDYSDGSHSNIVYPTINGGGVTEVVFVATSTVTYIGVETPSVGTSNTMTITAFSVTLADQDRSVNANGLAVHGTITKTAVATGADLCAYSGFSASNYLEQPYNSDLDFGTGDFSVMGWVKVNATTSNEFIFNRGAWDGSNWVGSAIRAEVLGSSSLLQFKITDDAFVSADSVVSATAIDTGAFTHIVLTRVGSIMGMVINGIAETSTTMTNALASLSNGSAELILGNHNQLGNPLTNGSLALFRISATAPSAAQIKTIYEAEKPLFQAGAQATLYGTSDAVTALAHDDTTNLLHVGTSSGRSVFQGLRRVDNTTSAVGSAISASNNLVVED